MDRPLCIDIHKEGCEVVCVLEDFNAVQVETERREVNGYTRREETEAFDDFIAKA